MTITYAAVVKDNKIAFQHALINKKNGQKIVQLLLPKLADSNHRLSLRAPNDKVLYIERYAYGEEGGAVTIIIVAHLDVAKRVVWHFVDLIKKYESGNDLDKSILGKLMSDANDPSYDQINKLNQTIDETKEILIEDIQKLISRGKQLEEIAVLTEDMAEQAETFGDQTRGVKNSFLRNLIMYVIILVFTVLLIAAAIFFIACNFPSMDRCFPTK